MRSGGDRMPGDVGEAGFTIHRLELVERIGIAGRRGREHRQAERGGHGGRNPILIGHELQRRDTTPESEGGMHLLQEPDACRRIEVVQEVREQRNVMRPTKFDLERAAGSRFVATMDPRLAGVGARDLEHIDPIDGNDASLEILLRHLDTEEPVTGGDVQNRSSTMEPSGAAIGAIIGTMQSANSTQAEFSGSTDPWPGSTVRPVRTISARLSNGSRTIGLPKNRAIEATHAGERESRNLELVSVLPYRPSVLLRSPMIVRKSHRMRIPRSEAEQRRAIEATSPDPSPMARNRSSSMAPRSAAVRW